MRGPQEPPGAALGLQGAYVHHLVAASSDLRTLCGRDVRRAEGWPYLQACHVPTYRAKRGEAFQVCSDCWVLVDLDEVRG